MKKLLSFLLSVLLLTITTLTAVADGTRLSDGAGLLTYDEAQKLVSALNSFSDDCGCDLAVVTVSGTGEKGCVEYADWYAEENFPDSDSVVMLVDMYAREWAISTSGNCMYSVSGYSLSELEDEIIPYLSSGEYYRAFYAFAGGCAEIITDEASCGYEYSHDYSSYSDSEITPVNLLLISIGSGLVIAAISTAIMRRKLTSVKMQDNAEAYVKSGSLSLRDSRELFLYFTVTKTPIPRDDNGPGGGVHMSGGGVHHGGSHGRF